MIGTRMGVRSFIFRHVYDKFCINPQCFSDRPTGQVLNRPPRDFESFTQKNNVDNQLNI